MSRKNSPLHPATSTSTPRASTGRLSRCRLGGAAIGLIALCAAPGTASALNLSTVYFRTANGDLTPGGVLDTRVVSNEQTFHFTTDDLQPALVGTSTQKVMVQYWSDSTSAEVHVFVRDPAELSAAVRDEAHAELFGDDAGAGWEPFVATPIMGPKVSVPYDLVVPYPNMDTFNIIPGAPPLPAEVFLFESKFVGPAPNILASPVDLPSGAGSVKGMRIYDHGACSAGALLDPIYDELQEAAWCKLKTLATDEGIDVLRWYTHAITQLDRRKGGFFTEVEDGFLMNAHFLAIIPDPMSDVDIHAKMESVFGLKDGHLIVQAKGADVVDTECTGAGGIFCVEDSVKDEVTKAIGQLRDGIEKRADETQSVAIGDCVVEAADPCAKARQTLALLVEDGALTLSNKGIEKFDDAAGEIEAMTKAVKDPSLWTCDKGDDVLDKVLHPDPCDPITEEDWLRVAHPTCRFFVPASRLNVYPDELELVWFDGKEVQNPAYALWVAMQSPFAPEGASQDLCAQQENDYSEIDSYTREYATSLRGVMYASQDW